MTLPRENDDRLLSAYLDGELGPQEIERLEARLKRDVSLGERLEAMRGTNAAAKDFFTSIADRPVPDALMQMLEASRPAASDNVVPFPARIMRRFVELPVAIAASVALVTGFLLNDVMKEAPAVYGAGDFSVAGQVPAGSPLYELLETGLSGLMAPISPDSTAELLLTFEDIAGDYCRQIRVDAIERLALGVACRRDGGWQFEALAYAPPQSPGTGFTPASNPSLSALDNVVDRLMGTGEVLDAKKENRLISAGWNKPAE